MSAAEPPTSIDSAEMARLSQADLGKWLWRRLHRRDRLAPPDARADEYWHLLFHDIYFSPEVDGDFRRTFRAAVLDSLADALCFPDARLWRDAAAVAELLMLAPDVLNDGTREEIVSAAKLLLEKHQHLPWRVPQAVGGQVRLRLRGLIALVELRWDGIPPEQHPPQAYWDSLWEPAVTDEHDPVFHYAGEQAGLIFEAVEKIQRIETPHQLERYKGIEAAFRWLGAVRPWREKYLIAAFRELLARRLLPQLLFHRVEALIQNESNPLLESDRQRHQLLATFALVTSPKNEPLSLPAFLGEAGKLTCSSAVLVSRTDREIKVFCEGLDREFLTALGDAVAHRYLNSPLHIQLQVILKSLRDRRGEILSSNHPLHSRFDRFEQFTNDQLENVRTRNSA